VLTEASVHLNEFIIRMTRTSARYSLRSRRNQCCGWDLFELMSLHAVDS